MPVWACPGLLCVWFCVWSIWLRWCTAAGSAFCSSTLRDPLRSKRNASPTQTNATLGQMRWQPVMGWHLLCHNLGSFHGSLNRKCNRAPACPCALPLPVLIESPSVGLSLCTYQIGFSWFDQQFKMVGFFLIIIIKKDAALHVLLWSICTNISAGDDLSQPEPGGPVCNTEISRGVRFIDERTNLPSLKAKSCPYVSVPSTANSTFPLCSHSCLSPR